MRFVALAAAAVAVAAWIAVATRGGHAAPPQPIAAAALDAQLTDARTADAAPYGVVLTVANDVRFLAPSNFLHTRVDERSLELESAGIRMVVGVSTGARLRKLDEPKQAAVTYAKQEHLELAEMTTPESGRTLARFDSNAGDLHVLYIVNTPDYRAVVLLVVDAKHRWNADIETLIGELNTRLMLP